MTGHQQEWTSIVNSTHMDLDKGINVISASQIRSITGKNPENVAYVGSERKLPLIMRHYGVFVVPISCEEYAIVRGTGYHSFENIAELPNGHPSRFPIGYDKIRAKTAVFRCLNHAICCGVIADFSGSTNYTSLPKIKSATEFGLFPEDGVRAAVDFEFSTKEVERIPVRGLPFEIDLAVQNDQTILLVEVNPENSEDFPISNLYFPYRISQLIFEKNARAITFAIDVSAHSYLLREYSWRNQAEIESIYLVKSAKYNIEGIPYDPKELFRVAPDNEISCIPQADDIYKIAELPMLTDSGMNTTIKWSKHYGITDRQGGYYFEAAEALGLVVSQEDQFELTAIGRQYLELQQQDRPKFLIKRILTIPIMNRVLREVRRKSVDGIKIRDIVGLIQKMSPLRGSTVHRRAHTVLAYFEWIGEVTGLVLALDDKIYFAS